MRTTSTRQSITRLIAAAALVAEAWGECRYASRRQAELQLGLDDRDRRTA